MSLLVTATIIRCDELIRSDRWLLLLLICARVCAKIKDMQIRSAQQRRRQPKTDQVRGIIAWLTFTGGCSRVAAHLISVRRSRWLSRGAAAISRLALRDTPQFVTEAPRESIAKLTARKTLICRYTLR